MKHLVALKHLLAKAMFEPRAIWLVLLAGTPQRVHQVLERSTAESSLTEMLVRCGRALWCVTKGPVKTQRSHGRCGLGPCGQVQRCQDFKRCVKENVGEVEKVLPLHDILLELLDTDCPPRSAFLHCSLQEPYGVPSKYPEAHQPLGPSSRLSSLRLFRPWMLSAIVEGLAVAG